MEAVPVLLSVTVASVVEPSVKVTLPVGVPVRLVIWAVKVTLWPSDEGLSEEDSAAAEVKPESAIVPEMLPV
jgi:hypothetical protein